MALTTHEADVRRLSAVAYRGLPEAAPYKRRLAEMKAVRAQIEPLWREIQRYILPSLGKYLDGDAQGAHGEIARIGEEMFRRSMILDSSPTKMALTAADGLHGGLTNPAEQWFSYYVGNYQNYEKTFSQESRGWITNAQECVRDVIANSNYYDAIYQWFLEYFGFGTALSLAVSDPVSTCRYYTKTAGTYWLSEDDTKRFDTAYIRYTSRAADIVRKYGAANCPERVTRCLENGKSDTIFSIIQCIQPWDFFNRRDGKPAKRNGYNESWQYEDVRFVEGGKDDEPILRRKGYRTKPFVAARWSDSGDFVYGKSSPCIDALPDIKQLQKLMFDYNMAVKWKSDPAFTQGALSDYEAILPGHVYKVGGDVRENMITPIQTPDYDIPANMTAAQQLRERISAILYNREILLVQSKERANMTATEVNQLAREASTVLGPVTVRIGNAKLMPDLDRTFECITQEWRILPSPPEEIANMPIKPYFTGQMAKAQRQGGVLQQLDYTLLIAERLTAIQSPARHSIDLEIALRAADEAGIFLPGTIRTEEQIEELKAVDARVVEDQQKMLALQSGADIAKTLGDTKVSPETAAGQIARQGGMIQEEG